MFTKLLVNRKFISLCSVSVFLCEKKSQWKNMGESELKFSKVMVTWRTLVLPICHTNKQLFSCRLRPTQTIPWVSLYPLIDCGPFVKLCKSVFGFHRCQIVHESKHVFGNNFASFVVTTQMVSWRALNRTWLFVWFCRNTNKPTLLPLWFAIQVTVQYLARVG